MPTLKNYKILVLCTLPFLFRCGMQDIDGAKVTGLAESLTTENVGTADGKERS